jgi:SlyX protein
MELDMSDGHSDSSRLEALETLVAHQDKTIAQLNDAITSQWRKIDALERQVAKLLEEFQNIGAPRYLGAATPALLRNGRSIVEQMFVRFFVL